MLVDRFDFHFSILAMANRIQASTIAIVTVSNSITGAEMKSVPRVKNKVPHMSAIPIRPAASPVEM